MELGELPRRNARRTPNKVCIINGSKKYTFQDFNQRINCLANSLLDLGVKKGDRVAVLLYNCSEYAELYFGLAKIGAIIVPLNFRLKAKEYLSLFKICSPTVFISEENFLNIIDEIRSSINGGVKHFIIVGENARSREIKYEDLILNSSSLEPDIEVSENDIYGIFFTSGTTGFPKGAMWTHRNILEQVVNLQIDLPFGREDIGLIVLPMFHGPGVNPFFS